MEKEVFAVEKKKLDLRVVKTKGKIKEALIGLLQQKDWTEISFKELAEIAKVSRNTLYIHYSSIQNVIEDKIDDFVYDFREELLKSNFFSGNISAQVCFGCFEKVLKKGDNYIFFEELFKMQFIQFLTEKNVKIIKEAFLYVKPTSSVYPNEIYESYATYLIGSCFDLYYKYVNDELNVTFDELIKNFDLLINETILSSD